MIKKVSPAQMLLIIPSEKGKGKIESESEVTQWRLTLRPRQL